MTLLRMRSVDGAQIDVSVDLNAMIGFGGFGSVYRDLNHAGFVVKRVVLPPQPLGNTPGFIAHIATARQRLLEIKSAELGSHQPRQRIIQAIDEIVDRSLSTHWSFDVEGVELRAVWFRQREAAGRPLQDLFNDTPPSEAQRRALAQDLIARMRTLRRADLVHLDCVPENVFVNNWKASLIDLDGCGVVRRSRPGDPLDEWDHRPLTLGHLASVRPPAWYPQAGLDLPPRAGNYIFAERWVVLDSVIRILSWNRLKGALSWLAPAVRIPIVGLWQELRIAVEKARSAGQPLDARAWRALYEAKVAPLRDSLDNVPRLTVQSGEPPSLARFAKLVQAASCEPRVLGASKSEPPPYDTYRDWLDAS